MQRSVAMSEYAAEVAVAVRAAREASEYLTSLSEGQRSVHASLPHDIKLSGDVTSESIIINVLRTESNYPILSEESGLHGTLAAGRPYWIVDPIDGTFNFYKGIPLVAISVALWRDDDPVVGIVHDIFHEELFLGVIGAGAWMNNNPISVSNVAKCDQAVLATGLPVPSLGDPKYVEQLTGMFRSFGKIRMLGSAALSLAYLSCGRVDAYAEDEILLWDVAAGIAVAKSAGGHVFYERTRKLHGLRVRAASNAGIWA